ncbi:hypothetical protein [Treponema sp. Marseille-Q3903]|uniref:helix-turn-helix transcriptional regulator n=1 Tax=Treponema sp. Marseille-Q3903 TaxID=2766703 RepID=UPI001651C050|nr:hypothetical protein [Treponema sp. Marseille-Q3903]MBC6712946.1 hypothetical protein [Treponema sp. Marseille-Q3903]
MSKNSINSERVVSAVGFLFLVVSSIASLLLNGDKNSIIEKFADTSVVIPCVHITCALITFFLIFKPSYFGMVIVLSIESILTILTDDEQLGIFLFYASIILILSKRLCVKRVKGLITALFLIHFAALLLTFTHGWIYTAIAIGYSVFGAVFYLWIYCILKSRLSCFLPTNVTQNQTIIKKALGSKISLSEYNLNERQVTFVMENLHNKLSYKEISDKYYVSISTVKKVFSEVYKIFNVSNIEELRILLLQYQVEE